MQSDASDLADALKSESADARYEAALKLASQGSRVEPSALLQATMTETVPQIRALLQKAIEAADDSFEVRQVGSDSHGSRRVDVFEPSALVEHEVSPAIGWLTDVAVQANLLEVHPELDAALGSLRRRVSATVALLKSQETPVLSETKLVDLVRRAWPGSPADLHLDLAQVPEGAAILTDRAKLHLLLSNAFDNARREAALVGGQAQVRTTVGLAGERFWIRVVNPFTGNSFDLSDVSGVGQSTRAQGTGYGVAIMGRIARVLGYDMELRGEGGAAQLTVAGEVEGGAR